MAHMEAWPPELRVSYNMRPKHPCWDLLRCLSLGPLESPFDLNVSKFPDIRALCLDLWSEDIPEFCSRALSEVGQLEQLTFLKLDSFASPVEDLASLAALKNLRTLVLEDFYCLRRLRGLEKLECLERLVLFDVNGLCELDTLFALTDLKELEIIAFEHEEPSEECFPSLELNGLDKMKSLAHLTLSVGRRFTYELDKIAQLQQLTYCSIDRTENIASLKHLPNLQTLYFPELHSPQSYTMFQDFPTLRGLKIDGLYNSSQLCEFSSLQQLTSLTLSECSPIYDLKDLAPLKNLRTLILEKCPHLRSLEGIKAFPFLEELVLEECGALEHIGGIQLAGALRYLSISGCWSLQNVDALCSLSSLETLHLNGCNEIREFPLLEEADNLDTLEVRFCRGLERVENINLINSIKVLDLHGCSAITDLSTLERFGAGNKEKKHLLRLLLIKSMGIGVFLLLAGLLFALWKKEWISIFGFCGILSITSAFLFLIVFDLLNTEREHLELRFWSDRNRYE